MKLAFDRIGKRPPVLVVLHGFTGNRASFAHLFPRWKEERSILAIDLPGHGESPLPLADGPEGFQETLDALEALLSDQGSEAIDLLGYSQGARLALGLCLRRPARIRRLILESVNPGLTRPGDRVARRREDEERALEIEREGTEKFIERWEALPLFAGLSALPASERDRLRARRRGSSAEGLAGALRCLGLGAQPDYWKSLPELDTPTLLITGANDQKFTEIATKASRRLPRSWHRIFEGCGHAPHLEAPDGYASEVLSFLCGIDTPSFQGVAQGADR